MPPTPARAFDPGVLILILNLAAQYGPVLAEILQKLLAKRQAVGCGPAKCPDACPADVCAKIDELVALL